MKCCYMNAKRDTAMTIESLMALKAMIEHPEEFQSSDAEITRSHQEQMVHVMAQQVMKELGVRYGLMDSQDYIEDGMIPLADGTRRSLWSSTILPSLTTSASMSPPMSPLTPPPRHDDKAEKSTASSRVPSPSPSLQTKKRRGRERTPEGSDVDMLRAPAKKGKMPLVKGASASKPRRSGRKKETSSRMLHQGENDHDEDEDDD
jgi:hypothetical protein